MKEGFLEKLLDGEKVEWKLLGDVCGLITTGKLNANAMEEGGNYPFFTCNEKPYRINSYAFDLEAILISGNGSQVGHLNYYKGKFNAYQRTYIVGDFRDVHAMYLFHYLNYTLKSYILQNSRKGSVPYITMPMLENFQIPIPCPKNPKKSLEIQAEIVRILDNFTELTAELTAELTTRKKQYNYYRDQLIRNSGAKSEKLEDISKIYLGLTYTPTYVDKGVKFISAQNTSGNFLNLTNVKYISEDEYKTSTSNAKPKRGDVLFTRVGSNLGHPVIVDTDEELCIFVSLGFIRADPKKVLNSYIKHWMNTDLFWEQVRKNVHGSAKVNLNTGWLNKFDVLLPTLPEQARIVDILDKFDALTSSITEGLPREIELRQKQYEYYRDLLLNFPRALSEVFVEE